MAFQQPPVHYNQPPYAPVPLPPQFTQRPTLAPMLQNHQKGAAISWAVCEHPSTAVAQMMLPDGDVWQNYPATFPYASSLTIWSEPTRDRPIVVIKEPYVTIGDVLCRVYEVIRGVAQERCQPIPQQLLFHPHEYPQSPPSVSEQQLQQWVLHCLKGRYTWKGLTFYDDMDSWWLHVR